MFRLGWLFGWPRRSWESFNFCIRSSAQLEDLKASFQLRPSFCACLPTFDLFNRLTCSKLPCTQSGLPVSPEQRLSQSQGMLFTHCLVPCVCLLGLVISDPHRKLFPMRRKFFDVPLRQGMTSAPRGVLSGEGWPFSLVWQ